MTEHIEKIKTEISTLTPMLEMYDTYHKESLAIERLELVKQIRSKLATIIKLTIELK